MTKDKEPLTPREARGRNYIVGSMLLGGVIAAVMIWGQHMANDTGISDIGAMSVFDGPIPPLFAIALAAVWAIILPVLSLLWMREMDEHERSAYRVGAEYASFAYMIGAPIWWILWRGGLVAPPDGVFIFVTFNFIYAGVWLWRKYH